MVRTSCGTEGFKNIKKSTPIAAQTAGISAAAVIPSIEGSSAVAGTDAVCPLCILVCTESHSEGSDVCARGCQRSGSWTSGEYKAVVGD